MIISYRKSDIMERLRRRKSDYGMRIIYFFGDTRSQIKYYNPETGMLTDPKKDISVKIEEVWGSPSQHRLIDSNGIIVLVNKIEDAKYHGFPVYSGDDYLGKFIGVTIDGLMRVRRDEGGEDLLIDPVEYVIKASFDKLTITREIL